VVVFPGFDQAHGVALRYGDNAIAADAAGTSGDKTRVRQARGEALTLGGGVVVGPQVLILGDDSGVGSFQQMAGLIGMPALAQFIVTFDAPHKRLILAPAQTPTSSVVLERIPEAAPAISPPAAAEPELPPEPPVR
jgi:hypothetical protein